MVRLILSLVLASTAGFAQGASQEASRMLEWGVDLKVTTEPAADPDPHCAPNPSIQVSASGPVPERYGHALAFRIVIENRGEMPAPVCLMRRGGRDPVTLRFFDAEGKALQVDASPGGSPASDAPSLIERATLPPRSKVALTRGYRISPVRAADSPIVRAHRMSWSLEINHETRQGDLEFGKTTSAVSKTPKATTRAEEPLELLGSKASLVFLGRVSQVNDHDGGEGNGSPEKLRTRAYSVEVITVFKGARERQTLGYTNIREGGPAGSQWMNADLHAGQVGVFFFAKDASGHLSLIRVATFAAS